MDNGIFDLTSGSSFFAFFAFFCVLFFTVVYICQNFTYIDLFWHYEINPGNSRISTTSEADSSVRRANRRIIRLRRITRL